MGRVISNDMQNAIVNLARMGKSAAEIIDITGVSKSYVYKHLASEGERIAPKRDNQIQLMRTLPATLKPKKRVCGSCGEAVPDGAKFCMHCGAKIETDSDRASRLVIEAAQIIVDIKKAVGDEVIAGAVDQATSNLREVYKILNK